MRVVKRNPKVYNAEQYTGQDTLNNWEVIKTVGRLEDFRDGMSFADLEVCTDRIRTGGAVVIVASCVVRLNKGDWLVGANVVSDEVFRREYREATLTDTWSRD